MTKRDDRISLVDMLVNAEEATGILGGASLDAMVSDRAMQLALQRLMEIVGEAATRVSQKTQEQHPEIAWGEIIGMRNRLAHAYDRYDLELLWDAIANDFPTLVGQLKAVVGKEIPVDPANAPNRDIPGPPRPRR